MARIGGRQARGRAPAWRVAPPLVLLLALCAGALGEVPRVEVGERLQVDVTTPVALEVLDPVGTEEARSQAASRVPPIHRYEPAVADLAEADLRRTFAQKRRLFLEAMTRAAQRSKLDPATVASPSFMRFVDWFRRRHPEFPLSDALARRWALHEPDAAVVNAWINHLRSAMSQCIGRRQAGGHRPENIRVVQAPTWQEELSADDVAQKGVILPAGNLLTLDQARGTLRAALAGTDPDLGLFLQGLLRENTFYESTLTEAARRAAVKDVLVLNHYEAGEMLGRRGDRVDARMKAAIDRLRAREASGQAETGAEEAGSVWNAAWSDPLRLERWAVLGLAGLAAASVAGVLVLAWMVRRKRRHQRRRPRGASGRADTATEYTVVMNPQRNETIFVPMEQTGTTGAMAESTGEQASPVPDEALWQQRALEAERRAEEILGLVRAGLAPQLARQMMHRLVRELVSQRAQWLQTQQLAEQDLAAIERRFTETHARLQSQLAAFERRAQRLEKALALKAEENSELLKAQISLTQQKLKTQKQSSDVHWN